MAPSNWLLRAGFAWDFDICFFPARLTHVIGNDVRASIESVEVRLPPDRNVLLQSQTAAQLVGRPLHYLPQIAVPHVFMGHSYVV
jgi:hypothetical protein